MRAPPTKVGGRAARALCALGLALAPTVAFDAWNDPYPAADAQTNTLYASFRERPKHLDPARSYSSNEYEIIAQIYEPPFQYHYLDRPYRLVPLTAESLPRARYYDAAGRSLAADATAEQIATSVYEITIRPGIRYQPHPCFAQDERGRYLYHDVGRTALADRHAIGDFPRRGTRELVAADYVYQIKRLAHPRLSSPIFSLMADYIVGLREYAETLRKAYDYELRSASGGEPYLDLTRYPLAGVQVVDRYTYRVTIRGKYPQFLYWMAMPFFAPMPPEADRFFSQAGMAEKNLTLDWYPIGTGPYMLTVNNPNLRMVLERNPNFHDERYPRAGEKGDAAKRVLADAGKPLPFVDKVIFSLERESIPYWNKFLQGYYDQSAVVAEGFDQAIQFGSAGQVELTPAMRAKGIELLTSVATSTLYMGFNMLDAVVGGYDARAQKLRQAISIAIDQEEYIEIFLNGRGIPAQGPLPPGLFGYETGCAGLNPYVYECVAGAPRRKPIAAARRLLAEAGYPDGVDPQSGKTLLLYYDTVVRGPGDKANLDWMVKQFAKLGVQLVPRATDYNRFQDKMRQGNAQIFRWGWNADYPDPENFLFLLYGPNKKVGAGGENAANYENREFDQLFERMKSMDDTPARLRLIREMENIARRDAPWVWGLHPKDFVLQHEWVHNNKPHNFANNNLKYLRLDPTLRAQRRGQWNRPILWPLGTVVALIGLVAAPAIVAYVRRENRVNR